MSELFHFAYISKLSPVYDASCVSDIVKLSRKNNVKNHLTGILVYDGENFFQYIEGEKTKVLTLLEKLKLDPRHSNFSILFKDRLNSQRIYNDWHLAYYYVEESNFLDSFNQLNFDQILNKMNSLKFEADFEP